MAERKSKDDDDGARQRAKIREDFAEAVNMTAAAIERWLKTDHSKAVGVTKLGQSESIGRQSARRIVAILRTPQAELDPDDYAHMRKVVGYVARHRVQGPARNPESSRWRYSLMNWGHDPCA